MLCVSLIQEEKNLSEQKDIYAISWRCELIRLFEDKELLKRNCLKPNIIRGSVFRNKKIIHCL